MSEQIVTPDTAALTVPNKDAKINLLDLNRQQMREFFKNMGEKPFRADQVMKWMYHYCCDDFDEMTDINKVLRGKLKEVAEIRAPEVVEEQRSTDGTIKWAIAVGDQRVETVYIPEEDRATLCVSSQVGCALECKFCSTAQQGFNRNLRVSEIIGQVWRAAKIVGAVKTTGVRPITNVVMMGMGEPLLNLNNVVPAMEIMLDDFGFGLSKRRVTLSTSGVVPALDKLGDMIDVALAISLLAANLRNAGLPLTLPAGAEPNLSLILGGAGARLEDIVAAYSAFARHGKAARLRLKPDDPLVERSLMSPGAAWIVRRILAGEAQPVPDASLPQVVPLAWKTGTSYGYRDAWAVGLNARYLIGIWTGRPDGTPVVGQFGFASAVPLLNQVNNLLLARQAMSRGGLPVDPRPQTVSRGTICWPGGQDLPAGDSNCRRRLANWLLDASQPPTLLLPGQEGVRGIRFPVWRNAAGERVAADCPGATEVVIDVWPLPLEPWLPASERRRARLGPVSKVCPPLQTQNAAPLVLSGIREGAVIKRLPGEARVMLPVQTSGGEGRRWWFINGQPLDAAGATTTLTLDKPGEWQLVVMDEAGQTAAASFTLQ